MFLVVVMVQVLFTVNNKNFTRFVVVKYSLCVGNFSSTRPIQDYGSGHGNPLFSNMDGLDRGMVVISANSWGSPPASIILDSADMIRWDGTCRLQSIVSECLWPTS